MNVISGFELFNMMFTLVRYEFHPSSKESTSPEKKEGKRRRIRCQKSIVKGPFVDVFLGRPRLQEAAGWSNSRTENQDLMDTSDDSDVSDEMEIDWKSW